MNTPNTPNTPSAPNVPRWIRPLFLIAALYDGLLGALFLVAAPRVFAHFNITPPNHLGYVQFPALLLIVFALMFFAIAADPRRGRNLIPYGILLKLSYSGVVAWHWLTAGVPWVWKPLAITDLLFALLFVCAAAAIPRAERT